MRVTKSIIRERGISRLCMVLKLADIFQVAAYREVEHHWIRANGSIVLFVIQIRDFSAGQGIIVNLKFIYRSVEVIRYINWIVADTQRM